MFQFSTSDMQSTASSLFSAYASFAAFMMMFRSLANEVVPEPVRTYLQSFFYNLFSRISSEITIVIDEQCGLSRNEVFDAAEIYLRTKVGPSTERFKVGKTQKQNKFNISIEKNEEIRDTFENFNLRWKFVSIDSQNGYPEKNMFELSFERKFRDKVLDYYFPYVLNRAKEIKNADSVVKLYTTDHQSYDGDDDGNGVWGSINLDHPSTFDTLAMDPEMKKEIVEDLERFLRRREYYKKVGKAWKRGYLLYGPPGTGKSSLIAAMANYLKFDIYDLELTSLYSNSELRRILVSTNNRSIIVIEDIDCSAKMQDRQYENAHSSDPNSKLTLSGVLNFIDGLWSSCGDERIIVFTTNHKDKLDPALLRPGRMDLHIHMSYCTYPGFKILASNYLGINDHDQFFGAIEDLLKNVQVTPAEIAEELMKSEDVDIALAGVVKFLKQKKIEASETKDEKKVSLEEERSDGPETKGAADYLETGRTEKSGSYKKSQAKKTWLKIFGSHKLNANGKKKKQQ